MITKKSRYEISLMRTAGSIVAEALQTMREAARPGISTAELDEIAEKIIKKNNAIPSFKGYFGYPASICASVNEQVVHGIPSPDVILKDGDIISIDVGATYKGLVGDSAITVAIGTISDETKQLLEITNQALYDAIEKMISGNCLQDISGAIEDRGNMHGLGIVKQYGGHGIGKKMHEDPFVFNYRTGTPGAELKPGMVLAIEPMFNLGTGEVHTLSDQWTVVTNDGKFSAHFEHTVHVSDDGPDILTLLK
ncbi:MAG: type I methionyl aminopeptidase [bacterium]